MPPNSAVYGLRRAELRTPDPDATTHFYRKLLDWTVLRSEEGFDCWVGERRCARVRPDNAAHPPQWRLVFAGAPENGELAGPEDTFASMVKGRAQHGPWAPRPRRGEPCWIELHTALADSADRFWSESLTWSVREDAPKATYTVRDSAIAARTSPRESDGSVGWLCYFNVGELDGAAERVNELGGSVLERSRHDVLGETLLIADFDGVVSALVAEPSRWGG
ncbi:VOC family protein [Actinopolyspora halophila]|uniref:VOC family protein n=1 Tax=Actinopolyspora halophila TaxID=1850 RepID=UPI000373EF58|nr:VOC family protein [Actinopolyspora halophila]